MAKKNTIELISDEEEKKVLAELSDEELIFILEEGDDFKAILKYENIGQAIAAKRRKSKKKFSSVKIAKDLFAKKPLLLAIAKKRSAHVKSSTHKILETLLDFTNPMSYLFLLIDTTFTLVTSIALITFAVAGAAFAVLLTGIGVVHFKGMYNDLKEEDDKKDRRYELLALQNECVDIYLKRHPKERNDELEEENENNELIDDQFVKPDNKRWQKSKNALGSMVLVTSTLFYSYYAVTLALTIAFAGAAFLSVMTGPVGIGVALGVALIIGIGIACLKYHQDSKKQILNSKRKEMERTFEGKYDEFYELRAQAMPKHNLHQVPPSNDIDNKKLSYGAAPFGIITESTITETPSFSHSKHTRLFKEKKVIASGQPLFTEDHAPCYPHLKRRNSTYF